MYKSVMNSPPFFSLGLCWEFPVEKFLRIGDILDLYRLPCCFSLLLFILPLPWEFMCLHTRSAEIPATSRGTQEHITQSHSTYTRWSTWGGGGGLQGQKQQGGLTALSVLSGEGLGLLPLKAQHRQRERCPQHRACQGLQRLPVWLLLKAGTRSHVFSPTLVSVLVACRDLRGWRPPWSISLAARVHRGISLQRQFSPCPASAHPEVPGRPG